MLATSRLPVLVLAMSFAACGPDSEAILSGEEAEQDLWSEEQNIVGGSIDTAHPEAVALVRDGRTRCSGVLIGPRTVLTAGHCIGAADEVSFGTYVSSPKHVIAIAREVRHPTKDLGLVKLAADATGIVPAKVNGKALTQHHVDRRLQHVGFGSIAPTGDGKGTKRQVWYRVDKVLATELWGGAGGKQACNGDSGGPAFMTIDGVVKVVGVTSYGDVDCAQVSVDARVDVSKTWITEQSSGW